MAWGAALKTICQMKSVFSNSFLSFNIFLLYRRLGNERVPRLSQNLKIGRHVGVLAKAPLRSGALPPTRGFLLCKSLLDSLVLGATGLLPHKPPQTGARAGGNPRDPPGPTEHLHFS